MVNLEKREQDIEKGFKDMVERNVESTTVSEEEAKVGLRSTSVVSVLNGSLPPSR